MRLLGFELTKVRRRRRVARSKYFKSREGELAYVITIFVITFACSGILEYISMLKTPGNVFNWGSFVSTGVLFFVAGEMYPVLRASLRLDSMFERYEAALKRINVRHSTQNKLNQTLLKVFDYNGQPAFEAATSALGKFVRTIEVEDEKISVRGDYLAKELYESFWDQIISAQSALRPGPGISVFATHASSAGIWATNQFSTIRDKQRKFVESGGQIFRIMLHEPQNKEASTDYTNIIERMREDGTKVFYLDRTKQEYNLDRDYLLVHFGGRYYVAIWYIGHGNKGSFSNLAGCKIVIGEERFLDYWRSWNGFVDELAATGDETVEESTLTLTPKEDEYEAMKDLPS